MTSFGGSQAAYKRVLILHDQPSTVSFQHNEDPDTSFILVPDSIKRFFHTKKYGRHRPRSRQNTITVCPLRACSATSLRHLPSLFVWLCRNFAVRRNISQDGVRLALTNIKRV